MKRILITGADGFIGSHLTEMLFAKGYKIKALSQYNSFNNWGWLEYINCKDEIEILTGDVRDPHYCKKITQDVDVIFHLAALIAIPYSYNSPESYVSTNINGTLNICQAAKENSNIRLIHISTSEVYGTAKYVPMNEEHPLQAQSPYSASKIAADSIAMSFFNSFELPVTIARPFNTYGPRQSSRAIIPSIITQIASGSSEIKLGDLTPTRDLNFVEDTCKGLMLIEQNKETIGETINIGSNSEISMNKILRIIKDIMNSDVEIIQDAERIRPEKSEVYRLLCDNSKLKEMTGYEPSITIKEGLKKTVNWLTIPENLKKYKSEIYNV